MNLIKIEVLNDKTVKCEREIIGQIGEGNETKLKFIVPSSYREYFKYLDILKGNGEKTQTVIGDTESEIFYYIIPHSLTLNRELFIQLVMKKGDKIFKSKMIALHFDSSISATPYLEESFQDTIEFIMENKADKNEIKDLQAKLLLKAGKSELFDLNENLSGKLKECQEKNNIRLEGLEVITESLRDKKVDKIYGKGLSSNDYTDEDKNKLESLPDNKALQALLSKKPEIITYNFEDGSPYDNYSSDGIYFFICEDGDVHNIETLYVWNDQEGVNQLLDRYGAKSQRKFEYLYDAWTEWDKVGDLFTSYYKSKITENSNRLDNVINEVLNSQEFNNFANGKLDVDLFNTYKEVISEKMDGVNDDIFGINTRLNAMESHIGEIDAALDIIIDIQMSLIGGDA